MGIGRKMRYTAAGSLSRPQNHSGFAKFNTRRCENGRGRKLEHHHVARRWAIATRPLTPEERRRRADGDEAAEGNSTEIFDGKVNGDDVAWKVSITNPMPLTLDFTGKVSGDSISGEMGIGPMGSFPFTGTRA